MKKAVLVKKTILAIAASATIAAGSLSAPTVAEARNGANAAAIGLGVLGAVVVGGAIANANREPRYYAPEPGYVEYRTYRHSYPVECRGGYWARRPLHDRWGNFVGWSRPRFICP
ncbi:MAG: hypothetical protein GC182_06835 [Rhodopseudomonas sp.]|nr:hypothetical protein [Rhodopseudomonas sp.]